MKLLDIYKECSNLALSSFRLKNEQWCGAFRVQYGR